MALSANVIWQKTGGSDTAGGGFDPSLTTNMYTDLTGTNANTATPFVYSASYSAITADVASWMFVGAGTNWYKGWWKINSLGAGAVSLGAGGTGYNTNDILTVSGGTLTTAATVKVTGQTAGVVTSLAIVNNGIYSVIPTGTLSTTGGAGSGCTLTLKWGANLAAAAPVTNSAGYVTKLGQGQSYDSMPTGGGYQTWAKNGQFYTMTSAGVASTASPTSGTWAIDRSRVAAVFAGGTVGTSTTTAFTPGTDAIITYTTGQQDVGNIIYLSGTGITTSLYAITNATSTIYTLDRSPGTAGSAITWNLGGSFATIGGLGAQVTKASVGTSGQRVYINGSETLASSSANVATGVFSASNYITEGFNSVCGDLGPGAYISAGSITSITIFTVGFFSLVQNIVVDGNSGASVIGVTGSSVFAHIFNVMAINCTGSGTCIGINGGNTSYCYFYNCKIGTNGGSAPPIGCVSDLCTTGFSSGTTILCIATNCVTSGFGLSGSILVDYCVAYKTSSGNGFDVSGATGTGMFCCVSYGNSSNGVKFGNDLYFYQCALGSNTSGNYSGTNAIFNVSQVTLTSDPYAGNHIGGATDLVVNSSNNTWVTTATNTTAGGGGSAQSAQDIGLSLWIYGGTGWTPGCYTIIGYDSGTGSWILNFSPAAASTTGGKWRIADFRPNNVAGGGALLRGAGIGPAGQVDAIDIGAVQHGPQDAVLTPYPGMGVF